MRWQLTISDELASCGRAKARLPRRVTKVQCRHFASEGRKTAYYREIIPAMADWFETEHYVFTHGWIPCMSENGVYRYRADWRSASEEDWAAARWINGMDAAPFCEEEKTVLCGHWHASYGHFRYV